MPTLSIKLHAHRPRLESDRPPNHLADATRTAPSVLWASSEQRLPLDGRRTYTPQTATKTIRPDSNRDDTSGVQWHDGMERGNARRDSRSAQVPLYPRLYGWGDQRS